MSAPNLVKFTPSMLNVLAGQHGITLPFDRDIFIIEIHIAGTSYREDIDKIEPLLKPGQMYRMVREPENKFDKFAIEIYFEDYKLGYVPAAQNQIVARLMDAGKMFFCKLIRKHWKGNWLNLETEVYMKD